mgnify:CR=1 FL=1
MTAPRWVASTGVLLALVSAAAHYLAAPPPRAGVVANLALVWPVGFTVAALVLAAALIAGRLRYGAHVLAAGLLSTYAVALWSTAVVTASSRGVVTAGLATALAMHALLLASIYSPGGVAWGRN